MPTPEHPSTPNSQPTTYSQAELAKELETLGIDYARDILGQSLPIPTDPDADINDAVAKAKAERDAAKPEGLKLVEQLNHTEQYQAQVDMLRQAGVIETLPSGAEGIIGIDGREYPLPTLEQVESRLAASTEQLKPKIEQGFTQLLLVPFGIPLDKLTTAYGQALRDQADSPAGLKSSDGTTLQLDYSKPVWVSSAWRGTDTSGGIVYYPERFDRDDHGGQTKTELIDEGQAWQIILVEDMTDIPAAGTGQELSGRPQLEAGSRPDEYLGTLQMEDQYTGESGLIPEAWLTLALTRLDESGEVLDDYEGNGKADYLLGAYNLSAGRLPYGCWARGFRQAGLGDTDPGSANDGNGLRSAVRIF